MNIHPEVLKEIEAGPQRPTPCPLCKGSAVLVSRGFTGKEATHWCSACKGTGGIEETPQEFAHRCVQRAVELEREECAKVCEFRAGSGPLAESMGAYRILTSAADAIRRRGKL